MREICLDTETTGLDPKDGHRLVEIACVEMIDGRKTGEVFHTYINPRRDVPEDAFRIHGLSTEFLRDKPIFDHIAHKFLDFIAGAKLVIHNAAFDVKFLNYELGALGLPSIALPEVIDTLLIARKKFPGAQNSLDALCRRFGVDLSKRSKHAALVDTDLLCDVYVELMGGLQSGFSFAAEKTEIEIATFSEKKTEEKIPLRRNRTIPARNFPVSTADLEQHHEFISKNFKENLWYN